MMMLARRNGGQEAEESDRNGVLASLSSETTATLRPHLQEVSLRAGAALHSAGAPITHVYFPLSGLISTVTAVDGRSPVGLALTGRDGIVGSIAALGVINACDDAIVQIPGRACRMGRSEFLIAYRQHASFAALVDAHNALAWEQAKQLAACNAVHALDGRLANWLLQARDCTGSASISVTQAFLSEWLGVQRTSVTMAEAALMRAGVVRQRRGRVEILDLEGLEQAACDCYARFRSKYQSALMRSLPVKGDGATLQPSDETVGERTVGRASA